MHNGDRNNPAARGTPSRWFWGVLLLALVLRLGVVAVKFSELTEDRDAYLGIARQVWAGAGYSAPGTEIPTAFRPPLYPLLLAFADGTAGVYGIAMLQILAGLMVVGGTYLLAKSLALSESAAVLAAGILAVDPLLLRYTSQPMTEIVCTALLVWMVWAWQRVHQQPSMVRVFCCGILSGLMMLCRPGMLPWIGVLAGITLLSSLWSVWRSGESLRSQAALRQMGRALLPVISVGLLSLLVLLPWGVRNAIVMGQFKLTTTHGGYTVLLGNNAVFYEAVVRQPWGTTWGDYPDDHPLSQAQWYAGVQAEMAERGLVNEFEQDRWQYQQAWQAIQAEPLTFLRSCLLRQTRLWWPVPIGPEARQIPRIAVWLIGGFYAALYVLIAAGLLRWIGQGCPLAEVPRWSASVALVLTIMAVHTLYWSNARMRTPVLPILAVAAVAAGCSLQRQTGKIGPTI